METGRPAWVEVDLAAIRHNVRIIQELIGPRCAVMAVVKANAYGHGLVPVARAALEAGAGALAVALPGEGLALRAAGITAPILVLGGASAGEAADAVAHDLAVGVDSLAEAQALSRAAERQGRAAQVHVKIDSGMGRRGVLPAGAPQLLRRIRALPGIAVAAAFTHFATADDDPEFAREQTRVFQECLARLRGEGQASLAAHAASSAAILRLPEARHDSVRPGIMLYGIPPYAGAEAELAVRPALQVKARIVCIKELPRGAAVGYGRAYVMQRQGRIAVVPLGYGDGFSRHSSNNGEVLVRGRRVPIRGRICMDQFMIEVTDVPRARVGDEVVILGTQGEHAVPAAEIARRTGTIPYETVCALTERLPRRYVG